MFKHRFAVGILVLVAATFAYAQSYPTKPVRIVTADPGASVDIVARLLAQGLTASLGQPIIVENHAGSVVISAEAVAHATPDGHSLLLYGSTMWLTPLLQKVPYDAIRDFSPISLVATSPLVVVVHPALPAASIKELIALAKSKPGSLNVSTSTPGSVTHLAPELFKSMAGINIVTVPYKGGGPALTALLGGEVQVTFATATTIAPQLKSDKLKVIAVTSAEPSALFPGLTTVAASGLPGYEVAAPIGFFAPSKTPADIVRRLNQETLRVLAAPGIKEKFLGTGSEVVGTSAEGLAAAVKADIARIGKLVKDTGIRAE